MKGSKTNIAALAEKCKSILLSNWRGSLNTIHQDAKASKDAIYTSKVKYVIKKKKPYLWIPESDWHNLNIMVDERASFSITRPFPVPLAPLLKSMNKPLMRIALTGEIVAVRDGKVDSIYKYLEEVIETEERVISGYTHAVQSIFDSSSHTYSSRCDNLKAILDDRKENYSLYKFIPNSCMFIGPGGASNEIDMEDMERAKPDPLALLSTKLVDGVNRSESRRRALILFCMYYLNTNARDVYMLSIDKKGFDVLAKVPTQGGNVEYLWREFKFTFKEEVHDIEAFCGQLMKMEEEVVKKFASDSGLGV